MREPGMEPGQETESAPAAPKQRQHRATYAHDNRKGGYIIRVVGPNADRYAGREVPVTLKSGDEQTETLDKLIWTGQDRDTGKRAALYTFVTKPRELDEQLEF